MKAASKIVLLAIFSMLAAACDNVEMKEGQDNLIVCVDLGLPSGVKWATCNVGATKPTDFGDYYAWGETEPKKMYTMGTYVWYNETDKYNTGYSVTIQPIDDVAHLLWKANWRIPTEKDWTELKNECTWNWILNDTTYGFSVIGPNGSSIFLPAAGSMDDYGLSRDDNHGNYWSSTIDTDYNYPNMAKCLSFFASTMSQGYYVEWYPRNPRYHSFTIRPVFD